MSDRDLELAREFLGALADAARTGESEAIYPLLAPDVEWSAPQLALRGVEEVRERMTWLPKRENLDVEFGEPELTDLGSGRIVSDVRETYRVKDTGDFAYARARRIELTIQKGVITRYEMRFTGS
jgi:hypothetical protein